MKGGNSMHILEQSARMLIKELKDIGDSDKGTVFHASRLMLVVEDYKISANVAARIVHEAEKYVDMWSKHEHEYAARHYLSLVVNNG